MQTKHLCVLIHIWTKGEVGTPWNQFKPSSKMFYWPFQGLTSFVDHLCYLWLVFVMLLHLFIAALWSPAGKGLTSWLLFVMLIVILLLSHLVSCDRCGTWLYPFLILAVFLTLLYIRKLFYYRSTSWHFWLLSYEWVRAEFFYLLIYWIGFQIFKFRVGGGGGGGGGASFYSFSFSISR